MRQYKTGETVQFISWGKVYSATVTLHRQDSTIILIADSVQNWITINQIIEA